MKRRVLLLAAAISLATAGIARAQEGTVEVASDAQLILDADLIEGVDRDALRAAIAAELGVQVVLAGPGISGKGTMRVRLEAPGKVTVSFRAEGGKEVGRTLDLPKKPDQAVETIALILGNLVRNEAAELLELLKPKPKALPAPAPAPVPAPAPELSPPSPPSSACTAATAWVGIDAIPSLGWNQKTVRRFSFSPLITWSRGVRAFELAGAAAITDGHVCGVQIGGAAATASGELHGVQLGGAVALSAGKADGLQIGGAAAMAWGGLRGVQLSGAVSAATDVRGMQISTVNLALGSVYGMQLGALNIATGDVRGVQLGVVNIARDADVPIGVLSIMTHGRTHFDVWGNETGLGMLEVVHGGRRVHNLYGLGARVGPNGRRAALMLGLGVRAFHSEGLTVDVDATATQIQRFTDWEKTTVVSQLRAVVAVKVFEGLAILAGPTWSVMWSKDDNDTPQASVGLVKLANEVHGWPGITLGLRAF